MDRTMNFGAGAQDGCPDFGGDLMLIGRMGRGNNYQCRACQNTMVVVSNGDIGVHVAADRGPSGPLHGQGA